MLVRRGGKTEKTNERKNGARAKKTSNKGCKALTRRCLEEIGEIAHRDGYQFASNVPICLLRAAVGQNLLVDSLSQAVVVGLLPASWGQARLLHCSNPNLNQMKRA